MKLHAGAWSFGPWTPIKAETPRRCVDLHNLATRSGLDVLEIDDADDILHTADDWRRSSEGLRRAIEAVERFAARLT